MRNCNSTQTVNRLPCGNVINDQSDFCWLHEKRFIIPQQIITTTPNISVQPSTLSMEEAIASGGLPPCIYGTDNNWEYLGGGFWTTSISSSETGRDGNSNSYSLKVLCNENAPEGQKFSGLLEYTWIPTDPNVDASDCHNKIFIYADETGATSIEDVIEYAGRYLPAGI